ncbi:hypothetical protein A3C23_02010 [Candidatus Roizmanbacteria bacterium RIFCSPHIGHO2_02_FULL_37_13b]|uniref:Uncharacterized protein n=1 Tax=Candidatus Roizmanbacteria bacterium RIFCSPLOWO2_02_FULL_36_11 TaxID=1802071 RepID=A0A1F7JBN2_9BACT|nr:MAG: hypothetical protein A3C23_02010 [Candidatus Roizmanbacteria bacterium RIFCSPHIGHO2_02_FULL_37_13b]OGK53024.1 MAG: hypothetical protein A3H78_02330 [Candidatus Roizmanbacteria bacterium RIFCSPLOWO2_02_FULL_36_11]
MCLAKLFKVKLIKERTAIDDKNRKVKLNLIKNCKPNDYLLVLSDIAVEKVSKKRALQMRTAL